MPPLQISHPSIVFKNQLRDGVAPIEACAFNAPRREFLAVDASALRVWGLKRVIKTIMAPSKVRYALLLLTYVLYSTLVSMLLIPIQVRSTRFGRVERQQSVTKKNGTCMLSTTNTFTSQVFVVAPQHST